MSTFADFVGAGGFPMPALQDFVRLRAGTKPDPYDPDSVVEDWTNPTPLAVRGYLSSQSTLEQPDEVRSELQRTDQLIIPDASVDIRRGDRIEGAGGRWVVQGLPKVDRSPFTGWQPTLACNLLEVTG